MIYISPSILACDFSKIGEEIKKVDAAGADMIHVDVMDGHFVPNITIGPPVIKKIRKATALPFDVHLMISEPLRYTDIFCSSGADSITFHVECGRTKETIEAIKSRGVRTSLCVKPATPVESVFPYLDKLNMVLIMTVEPGFGGQSFMYDMLPKIRSLRQEITKRGLGCDIEVDGGINPTTAALAIEAGANVLVAGSAVFNADDPGKMIKKLKG
ncbi:MAG: ribulose-phosphate 3-epimerase, partial [Clostridia bacterium]|nr:ribulose-phosphate 3-epimerase [Clostridia bacterium]